MTNAAVQEALDRMEAWLQDASGEIDPEALQAWNSAFADALASAERGKGWEPIAARAHALGARLEKRLEALEVEREAIRKELGEQALGGRALKAYRPQET